VEHGLAGVGSIVAEQAPAAGLEAVISREARGHLGDPGRGGGGLRGQVPEAFAVGLRNDEQVHRRLGEDVLEGEQVLVLVDQGRRDLLPRDLAEQAFSHQGPPCSTSSCMISDTK